MDSKLYVFFLSFLNYPNYNSIYCVIITSFKIIATAGLRISVKEIWNQIFNVKITRVQ